MASLYDIPPSDSTAQDIYKNYLLQKYNLGKKDLFTPEPFEISPGEFVHPKSHLINKTTLPYELTPTGLQQVSKPIPTVTEAQLKEANVVPEIAPIGQYFKPKTKVAAKKVPERMLSLPEMQGLYTTPEGFEKWVGMNAPVLEEAIGTTQRKALEKGALAEMKYNKLQGNQLNEDLQYMAQVKKEDDEFISALDKAYKRGVGLNLMGVGTQLPILFQRRMMAPDIEAGTFEAPRFQMFGPALKRAMQSDIDKQLATAGKLSREMGKPEVSLAANLQGEEAMLKANIAALTADSETINKTLEAVSNANNMTEQSRVEAARLQQQYQLTLDQGTEEQKMMATTNIMEYLNRLANLDTQRFQSLFAYKQIKEESNLRKSLAYLQSMVNG